MKLTPTAIFNIFNIAGLSLMFAIWLNQLDTLGFLLLLFLALMCLIRSRFNHPNFKKTIFIDLIAMVIIFFIGDTYIAKLAVTFLLFQTMFIGYYPVALLLIYSPFMMDFTFLSLTISVTLIGLILNFWQKERNNRVEQRDYFSKKNYELENLQNELTTALAQVEQMSIIAERSRISADIHDNAGHEIVASYITLQTVRKIMEKNPEKALELFDKSMDRLGTGVGKMRDAVHNMSVVTFMGVDRIREICANYRGVPVEFKTTGDMTGVTVNIWHVLEALLNESLTNVMKHAKATYVRVELDATKHLVRLLIENDGIEDEPMGNSNQNGIGLRNLRYRVVTVGGNLTVDKGDTFKVVCVIPIN